MKKQLKVLDVVAILEDIPEQQLIAGQVGTLVEELAEGVFQVEFSDDQGQTYAMVPLRTDQLIHLHYAPVAA